MKVLAVLLALIVLPAYACRTEGDRYRATYGNLKDLRAEFGAQREALRQLATEATIVARLYVPDQSIPVDGSDLRLRFEVRKLFKGTSEKEFFASIPGGFTVASCGAPPSFWLDKNPTVEVNREYLLHLKDGVVLRAGSTRSREDGLLSAQEEALIIRRATWLNRRSK